jgi:hypothetical protein
MFTKLREPFGKAGLIVAVVALVFAMLGGAYAATNNGGGKATASAKGKPGKQGKPGKTGPQGPAGSAGAPGAKGDTGAAGGNGTNGTNGVSPVGTKFTGNSEGCTEGGVKFVGTNTTVACNGAKGTTGFTETLPSQKTESGIWSFGPLHELSLQQIPIASFTIPLASPLPPAHVHYINAEGKEVLGTSFAPTGEQPSSVCLGTPAEPTAKAGNLCVYAANENGANLGSESIVIPENPAEPGASVSGAFGFFKTGESASGFGGWAVTAE